MPESDGSEPQIGPRSAVVPAVGVPAVVVLVVAVLAISSSAVLVRLADASPVALAFWRTLGGALILAPSAWRSPVKPTQRQWWGIALAGIALALHFSSWLASLELTSVAASVTLVATAPLMIAAAMAIGGRSPGGRTWLAIGLAVLGTFIIAGGDAAAVVADTDRSALIGDGLALIGAATMAVYLMTGDRLRSTLSTAGYASRTYAIAALTTMVVALASGIDLVGFDTTTWLAIAAMILGPQLAGHTALNYLLGQIGSVTISLALLIEPLGAGLLVWLLFGDIPPLAAAIGAPLVIIAVALQVVNGSLTSPRPDSKVQW